MRRRNFIARGLSLPLLAAAPVAGAAGAAPASAKKAATPPAPITIPEGLELIDSGFENASPLWYEFAPDGTILINLLYDHERDSPNRAAGHFHFMIQARPGARFTLEFKNLDNIYNGRPGSVAKELKAVTVSQDGLHWKSLPTEILPENRVRLDIEMAGPKLYVARVEPYRLSDLNNLLTSIRSNPLVKITTIGQTVEGRDLEIVQLGNPQAPYRAFLRARAHPWESGGNWVVQGLVKRLLRDDPEAKKFLQSYCVWILPLANKDGVAHGRTRFNMQGKDLNRDWEKPADPRFAPENAALEQWLEGMIKAELRPHLALELHNDGNGNLHVSRATTPNAERFIQRMATLEKLLRKHTWFTEGAALQQTASLPGTPNTLGLGWLQRFDIDAAVHEFNCHWIAGLKDYPSSKHWMDYGAKLADVFFEYFNTVKP